MHILHVYLMDEGEYINSVFNSIVNTIGSLVFQRLMRIIGIVFLEVFRYSFESFFRAFILIPINLILLETSPESFSEDIVSPSPF